MKTTVRATVGNYILTSVMVGGVVYSLGDKKKVNFKGDEAILFYRSTGKIIGLGKLRIR